MSTRSPEGPRLSSVLRTILAAVVLVVAHMAISAAAVDAKWKTVACSSDFSGNTVCCQWCHLIGCDDCIPDAPDNEARDLRQRASE